MVAAICDRRICVMLMARRSSKKSKKNFLLKISGILSRLNYI
jgi:hypothetical protein